jgi:CSLREA domain-containing protein
MLAGIGLALMALVASATPAAAKSFTVNSTADQADASAGNGVCQTSSGACTLRAAIQEANALVGADDVTVPAGHYNIASALNITSSLAINAPAGARSTIIDGSSGPNVDLQFSGSGVDSASGFTVTGVTGALPPVYISGPEVTLTGFDLHGNAITGTEGGGVDLSSGQLAMYASSITDNTVTNTSTQALGGGVSIDSGSALIVATTIARNKVNAPSAGPNAYGGGVFTSSNLTLRHVTLLNNIATAASAAQGGGNIFIQGNTQISDSIIAGGQGDFGPDCYLAAGTLSVSGRNIYPNAAGNCAFPAGTVAAASTVLTPLADHGGTGLTALPTAGSAAIDGASACPDGGLDQRASQVPIGPACDIGAAEVGADLQMQLTASATQVGPGDQVTYVARVTNAGRDDSPSTVVSLAPPAGAAVVLLVPSAGSCADPTSCDLGTLASGQSGSVTMVVKAPDSGSMHTTAVATGGLPDPTPADAAADATTTVLAGTPPPDVTPPVLSGLTPRGRLTAKKGGKLGAKLSEAATVKLGVSRLGAGRKRHGKCNSKNKTGGKCTIAKALGTLTHAEPAGTFTLTLPSKIGKSRLTPGRYRLTATATDAAGNRSRPLSVTVTVG